MGNGGAILKEGTTTGDQDNIIAICGMDGAGKTTQINLIGKWLEEHGIAFKKVWLRWPAFFSYPFLALCRLLGFTEWKETRKNSRKYPIHHFYRNNVIARIWSWLFTLDTLIYLFTHVYLSKKLGRYILSDRHTLDILVDLICETKRYKLPTSIPGKLLLSFLPKLTFLIDVKEKTAFQRKKDIPSIKYLTKRRKLFRKLAKSLGIPILHGDKKPKEVHNKLLNRLKIPK